MCRTGWCWRDFLVSTVSSFLTSFLLEIRRRELTSSFLALAPPPPYFLPKDVAPADQTELFIRKLQQCSVVFDFNDASADLQGKGIKGQALHEMLEYITTPRVAIPEQVYVEVIAMVSRGSKDTRD